MTILDEIMQFKKQEVADRKSIYPVKLLEQSIFFDSPKVSFKEYLKRPDKLGIIAEFKRKSPSKGEINGNALVEKVTIGYMKSGASALSVLTDQKYFGGNSDDLKMARKFNFCPILRKDFVCDEYQILEAKSMGADVILLIAAALTVQEVKDLSAFAKSIGLEVLLEIHNEAELEHYNDNVDVLGVNNRDLKRFKTDIQNSIDLFDKMPKEVVKISESGIHTPEHLVKLKNAGFEGFLIGEGFMKSANPVQACQQFIKDCNSLIHAG